uniref:Matrix remodeling associated 5 n=1 Tax=Catagonus wagneri TaxID=51154 RepID=A0A8C3W2P0_9CETA
MPAARAPWRALSVVLILVWGHPRAGLACPHPCACYVPSEVHCTFRSLASVPAGISKHVERINLGFNSIQALSETSLAGLTKLELLMIHGNEIHSVPDGALSDLTSLQVFKFSYNKLRVLTAQTLQGLWSLVRLHLDHNQIEFIHPHAFRGLTSLRLLHLEGNLLRQLHADTFSTFAWLDLFRLSTLRHLYLAENRLQTLPRELLQGMPLLENLYLQGNPWACDCDMRWFLDWDAKAKGILKCKKDKAYEGGQLCATCASPKKLHGREIQKLTDVACQKPSIASPLRQNRSRGREDEPAEEEGDVDEHVLLHTLQGPRWNVSLNLSDEHGNTVHLLCDVRKPARLQQLHLNQTDPQEIELNATLALDFECPMTRGNYEKLWKLIAYYSKVPVKLRQEAAPGQDPSLGSHYRQDAAADTLYYTGVRAHVLAEPGWILQPALDLQLNRRRSTAATVLLAYSSRYAVTVPAKDARPTRSRSWVMIEPSTAVQRAQTVLEGSPCQLSCNVKASERPSIRWVLPDGSVLKAPWADQDGRLSVLTSGWLKIQSTEPSDAGLYQCIAQVTDEVDQMGYRVLVQPPAPQAPDGHTVTVQKDPGEPLTLPCQAQAVPEAQISWILPHKRIVNDMANTSHAYLLADGTLSIPEAQGSDSGYYRCVAVNQHGADHFTVAVAVTKKGSGKTSKRGRRPPAGKTPSRGRGDLAEDEAGSGFAEEAYTPRRVLHPQDQEMYLRAKDDAVVPGGSKAKKGRRKLKPWKSSQKEPETSVAEGRRVFESRRRIHMANKQINPQHWADILARVRGRNPPKGTQVPQVLKATTPPAGDPEATSVWPAAPPPSGAPVWTTAGADEGSGDASLFGEEDQVASTALATGLVLSEPGHRGVTLGAPQGTRAHPGELTDDDLTEKGQDAPPTAGDLGWAPPTASLPLPSQSSAVQTQAAVREGPTHGSRGTESWSAPEAGSTPQPASDAYEPPSSARPHGATDSAPYARSDPETRSPPDENRLKDRTSARVTPRPTLGVADARTSEPFEDPTVGETGVPAHALLQGHGDNLQLVSRVSTQGHPLVRQGSEEEAQTAQEEAVLDRGPANRGNPETQRQGPEASTRLDSALGVTSIVAASKHPKVTARLAEDATTVARPAPTRKSLSPAAPTTAPSRSRPHGKKRLRTHRLRQRQRQRQRPPTTSAPPETFSNPPTRVPEGTVPEQAGSLPVPTSWPESAIRTPQQPDARRLAEPVSKGPPRKKHEKRPNRPRYGTATASPTASVSPARPSPESKGVPTSTSEAVLPATTVSLPAADPLGGRTAEGDGTTSAEIHFSADKQQEASPLPRKPVPARKEMENLGVTNTDDYKTDRWVPGESAGHAASPFGATVSSRGESEDASEPSGFPGSPGWTPPPGAARPEGLQPDPPPPGSSEAPTDSPFFKEVKDPGLPSKFPPLLGTSTLRQPEEWDPSPTLSGLQVETSWGPAETSIWDESGVPPATLRPEGQPQPRASAPVPVPEPASPFPPTAPASLAQTTTRATTPLTSRTSPAPKTPEENPFRDGKSPETTTPAAEKEGTQPAGKPDLLSTLSPVLDKSDVTPKPGSAKAAVGGTTANVPPRGPDSRQEAGAAQVFQPPARGPTRPVPSRDTERPPQTTKSPFRSFVTLQPSRPMTSKPEMTAPPSRVLPTKARFPGPTLPGPTSSAVPPPGSTPSAPGEPAARGPDRPHGSSKALASNNLPDLRDPAGKPPQPRVPLSANGRLPFFFNRTPSFPQLAVTPKPPIPTSPAPVTRKVDRDPSHRIHSQSISHVDFGPPAPPFLHAARTAAPPSTNVRNIPAVFSTRSSIPFVTPSAQPSRSFHHSSSKLFSAAGPPASKFWTLGEKPQIITKSPPSVSVTAETDVVFPCEATGQPQPFVTWTKVSTGALMTPNTRVQRFEVLKNGTFVIRNVQVQDGGQYMCTAKNLHGADRSVVLLTITVQQPQIPASQYKDVTVYLGDTIAMECLAKGTPAPQISWIFPDRSVWQTVSPVEGRITLHENRTLSIKEASFSDRGVYQCVASNAAGADSLAIRLHVAALPPVIQQEKLENVSLPAGLSIHVHCTAKAAPLPSVRWVLADGTQIRPSQFLRGNVFVFPNGTLYIRNLAPKDSGRYECVAANLVGSARRAVQLSVQRAAANARITGTSPQRTDVRYGGTLQLDCSASGDPWPRILWRLPSKRVIDALFRYVALRPRGVGWVGDAFVMLKVNVVMKPAKIEHKEESDHRVFYGGDLKVDCVATGLPNPEISWSLPDGSLVNSFMQSDDGGGRAKRYVVFNNGTLYFNEVGLREEGDYTCVAENQVGKDEMTVRVKVLAEPPAIRNKTHSVVQVPYGDVVTVACEAKGEPTPRVTWLSPANRQIPASSEKYQIYPDGTLLIQKAQRSDSGNYTCVARNSAGEDRKTVWIRVHVQAPRINGNPDAITTVRAIAPGGSRKLIDCRAEGSPAPRVLWAFPEGVVLPAPYHGSRVTVHRNGTLDIRHLRKSDSVQLACIARNEGGEARLTVQLTVLEPVAKPIFHDPVSEKITAMAGHTISLNCSAAGSPTPTLLWVLPNRTELRSGQRLQRFYHKGDGRLHISDLTSVDAGAYRCVARNSAGYSERLVSLKVGLKPETGDRYHGLVSIVNGETLHLPCGPPGARPTRSSWTLPGGLVLEGPQARGRFTLWENGTLTVREASVFDRGTYVCKADTEHGPAVANVPVIVIAYPPRITSEPTPVIYTRPGSTVKMNCMVMAIPKAEITWELPDKSLLTAGTQPRRYGHRFLHAQGSLTVQQVTQRDAGFYKCTAKNILGSDSKTTYIRVY